MKDAVAALGKSVKWINPARVYQSDTVLVIDQSHGTVKSGQSKKCLLCSFFCDRRRQLIVFANEVSRHESLNFSGRLGSSGWNTGLRHVRRGNVMFYLVTDKLRQYSHRFGETLARSVDEPDITMKGVRSEFQRSNAGWPFLIGRCLRHQRNAHTVFDQFDDRLELIQLAHLVQGEMHLP